MSKLKDEKGKQGKAPRLLCDAHLKYPRGEASSLDKTEADSEAKLKQPSAEDMPADTVNTLIVQNPSMNAASFMNLLKAKGFKVSKEAQMSVPELNRAQHKEAAATITARGSVHDQYISFRFVESQAGADGEKYQNRFRVILIQEGE